MAARTQLQSGAATEKALRSRHKLKTPPQQEAQPSSTDTSDPLHTIQHTACLRLTGRDTTSAQIQGTATKQASPVIAGGVIDTTHRRHLKSKPPRFHCTFLQVLYTLLSICQASALPSANPKYTANSTSHHYVPDLHPHLLQPPSNQHREAKPWSSRPSNPPPD